MTEEHILEFLDGNLGASEEEELLHRLAVSPERRNLLKQHLQMRDLTATLARRQYVPVPKVLTASLFTALTANGYSGPSIQSSASKDSLVASLERSVERTADAIVPSNSVPFFKRTSILALASILSFLTGGTIVYLLMSGHPNTQMAFAPEAGNRFGISNAGQSANAVPAGAANLMGLQNSETPRSIAINHRSNTAFRSRNLEANSSQFANGGSLNARGPENVGSEVSAFSFTPISNVQPETPLVPIEFIHGVSPITRNPLEPVKLHDGEDRTFWNRISLSARAGEGKAPGNQSALTGSMLEIKAAYDVNDWLVAKVSLGQFMPYETEAVAADPGFNSDGIRLLQLKPTLQYRIAAGAELGVKFDLFDSPFEFDGGFISDATGNIIPRLGFFTNLALQENLSMNLGLEGMIYSHDISSSLRSAQNAFAGEHPMLIGALQSKESTGFIGPSVELVWRF